jgi:hypothetical protein
MDGLTLDAAGALRPSRERQEKVASKFFHLLSATPKSWLVGKSKSSC